MFQKTLRSGINCWYMNRVRYTASRSHRLLLVVADGYIEVSPTGRFTLKLLFDFLYTALAVGKMHRATNEGKNLYYVRLFTQPVPSETKIHLSRAH